MTTGSETPSKMKRALATVAILAATTLGGAGVVYASSFAPSQQEPNAIEEVTLDVAEAVEPASDSDVMVNGLAAEDEAEAAANLAAQEAAAAQAAADAEAARVAAEAEAARQAQAAADAQRATASQPSGAASGTPLPMKLETDPNNAQYGQMVIAEDPGSWCASHSGSTINGVPTCD